MDKFKGKAIYNPSGRAGEYSYWACNFYKGCSNGCTYCYLKNGILKKTLGGDNPELKQCFRDAEQAKEIFKKEVIQNLNELKKFGLFLTFSSDPFLPETIDLTLFAIRFCLSHNVPVKLLTKNNPLEFYPFHNCADIVRRNVAFGLTLTGHDELEPRASTNSERINALVKLHNAGFITWASIEPIIEVEDSINMIDAVGNHVDLVKIGLLSGRKYETLELIDMIPQVDLMARAHGFKVYFKDSFLLQTKVRREELPDYCVKRDYNIFK